MLCVRKCCVFFFICISPLLVCAQPYYKATAINATQIVGGAKLAVTPIGSAVSQTECGTYGPYRPGLFSPGGFKYVFSASVKKIRVHLVSVDNNDTLVIKCNNVPYNITSADLSFGTNACNATTNTVIAYNGQLTGTSAVSESYIQFDASLAPGVDSVEIDEVNSGSGVIYDFYFVACGGSLGISYDSVCGGRPLYLFAHDTGFSTAAVYSWTGPNGFTTATQKNPVIAGASILDSGMYVFTETDSGCVYTDSVNIAVRKSPLIPIAAANGPLCSGDTLKLSAVNIPGVTYNWTGPGGYNSSQQNPEIINVPVTDSGIYTVVASLADGCADTNTIAVIIHQTLGTPAATIISDHGNMICSNDTVTFSVSTINTLNTSYQWRKNGMDINNATDTTYTPPLIKDTDVFSCFVTSSAPCQAIDTALSNAITMHTTVHSIIPPVSISVYPPHFTEGVTTTFTAYINNSMGLSYQWRRNGINIPGAITSTYTTDTLHTGDVISIFVKSNIPCMIPDTAISNYISLGVQEQGNNSNLCLYPNPNKGIFTISGSVSARDLVMEIYNSVGQLLTKNNLAVRDDKINERIDLDGLPAGLYIIRLSGDGYKKVLSFMVNK